VDTVPFGSFRRSLVEQIGNFDESLLTNEDYEFNARLRQSGRTVWLDPEIRSVYFARPTLADLGRQYWRYGFWKWRMLRRYPGTLRWRQALPPAFVLSVAVLAPLCTLLAPARWLLAAEAAAYLGVLLLAGAAAGLRKRSLALTAGLPLAIATMHFAWGSGFLWSVLQGFWRNKNG
jgi:hypothetical protein